MLVTQYFIVRPKSNTLAHWRWSRSIRWTGLCLAIFVLEVVPRQRRVPPFFFINLENPISVLYSTKFHPQRNTFLLFPRPLWGTLAHPERTGAALDSSKANAPPWYFSAARLRGPSGETTAHRDLLRGCWPKSVQQTTWNCENHASRVRVRSVSVQ